MGAVAFLQNFRVAVKKNRFCGLSVDSSTCERRRRANIVHTSSQVVMGIKGLTKLLGDHAPDAIKLHEPKALFGRKLAIDASMCIYQLLVAVRMGADNLTNDQGVVTSHLNGIFYRSIRLLEIGIKPIFVFDGKPPEMKAGELEKRRIAKEEAEKAAKKAEEEGDMELAQKLARRVNRITPEMINDCKRLIKAMGIPVVEAPCEAEAQCSELVKSGLAWATASEDMDSLTFGSNRLIRQLWQGVSTTGAKKGVKVTEFDLEQALNGLNMNMDEFIDLCVLCGCDYVDGIGGIGPVTALNLMRKHKTLEQVVNIIKQGKTKYKLPQEYPVDQLRNMFVDPEIEKGDQILLKWAKPDELQIKKILVEENQFDESKITNGIKRLTVARKKSGQVRVDSFFTVSQQKKQSTSKLGKKSSTGKGKKNGGIGKGRVEKKGRSTKK